MNKKTENNVNNKQTYIKKQMDKAIEKAIDKTFSKYPSIFKKVK